MGKKYVKLKVFAHKKETILEYNKLINFFEL